MRHFVTAPWRLSLVCALASALTVGAAGAQQAATGAGSDVDMLSRAGDSRAIGPDTAKVIVLEFLDFACPTCQAFHVQRGDSLRRAIGPDVRVVFVNLLHPNFLRSFHAAEAATCASVAGGRDGYTAMADRLFRNPEQWVDVVDPGPAFTRFAREARVDSAAFENCRARDLTAPLLVSDLGTASTFGVDATPTFVVVPRGAEGPEDTFRVSGNVSIAELTRLISQARARAK